MIGRFSPEFFYEPPVNFTEHEEIRLALFPEGKKSACVITARGIDPALSPEAIDTLRIRLANLGVRATFFVSASGRDGEELDSGRRLLWELIELQNFGFEVAQAGFGPDSRTGGWKESIRRERTLLEELGFRIRGYGFAAAESPAGPAGFLSAEGYLYGVDFPAPPPVFSGLFFPVLSGNCFFLSHPRSLPLLTAVAGPNPARYPAVARKAFAAVHGRGGVAVFRIEFPAVRKEENLRRLEDFVRYLKGRETWICTLSQLCDWWRAREEVRIITSRRDDLLHIAYHNPGDYSMINARIIFKKTAFPVTM